MSALGQKRTFAVQNGMSALPPKADMCSAQVACPLCAKSGHYRDYWITSSARVSKAGGTVRSSALAALRLMVSSNLVGS